MKIFTSALETVSRLNKLTGNISAARFLTRLMLMVVLCLGVGESWGQTPVPMSSQPGLSYTENFADIANWTNNFAAGIGASAWSAVPVNSTGSIPDGVKTTVASSIFQTSATTGGIQRGSLSGNPAGTLVFLSTGAASSTSAVAVDLLLNFTGVNAGTISFDWTRVNNGTGDRGASLKVYTSTDNITFTELSSASVSNVINNGGTASGSILTVTLPAGFNNSSTARIRFYQFNGTTTGTSGSRPKISIDNLTITASSAGLLTPPSLTAAAGATVDAPFNVTFTDDAAWRAAITGITVGGTALTAGSSVSAGQVTFTPSASAPASLLQTAGTKSIVISAAGYTTATVSQTIGVGADNKLVMITQPTAPATNGAVLATQPVVAIRDQYGNATTSTASITAAASGGSWTIGGGTNPLAATSGTATFSGLTATSAAAVPAATITFSSGALTQVTSNAFAIPIPPPANDNCAGAVDLTVNASAVSGTFVGATPMSGATKNDVFFMFTPTVTGSHTVTINNFSTASDKDLYVYSVCPATYSTTTNVVASGTTTSTSAETATAASLNAGTSYKILVQDFGGGGGTFDISVTGPLVNCSTPASGASNLSFTSQTSTAIGGSFDKASTEPSGGYLVIQSTSSTLSSNPVDGVNYIVGSSIGGGTVAANIVANNSATYSFSSNGTLASNTQYYFFVIPYNFQSLVCNYAYGNGFAINNSTFTCPAAPATPTVGTITSTTAIISWSSPGGPGTITSYDLQWRVSPSGSFTSISNVTSPYTLNVPLTPGVTYDVQVRASNAVCSGAYSPSLTFTAAAIDAPVSAAANPIGVNSFTANWSAVSGALSYRLDVSTSPTFGVTPNATDLFISEYVEGSSNNKYIEIYNGTGASVNLSNYKLQTYANGSNSPTEETLTGTLANGSTIVYKNSGATVYGGAATVSTAANYNGDDAVALFKISPSGFVDIFGRIGDDPGTAWTSASNSTLDKTLVRKSTVTNGITVSPTGTGASAFTTLESEWTQFNIDVVSNLGSHTFSPAQVPSYVSGYENLNVGNVTSFNVTGLSPSTTYYFRVRAVSSNSTSANSSPITVLTYNDPSTTTYRTKSSGNLSSTAIWEYNYTGSLYQDATQVPSSTNNVVVQNGHTLTMDQDFTVGSGKTFTMQATSNLVISPNKTLTIAGSADFAAQPVTVKSDITGSGIIGNVSGTLTGATNVTVERFIGAATPKAAWRLLTAPLRSSTANNGLIWDYWQDSGGSNAGIGTQVTGPGGASGTTGIDQYTIRPSMQYFDHLADQNLHGVTDTKTTGTATPLFTTASSAANKSYFIFTRGDRSVNPGGTANNTTLRPTGTLQTGDQIFATATAAPGDNTLVGNPYASPVDLDLFRQANTGSNIKSTFYYWDPYLAGTYGYGGYVTASYNGVSWNITPSGGSHTLFLQSGQAMFLERSIAGTGTASVTFKENQKASTNAPIFLTQGVQPDSLAVNLNVLVNNAPVLVDAAMTNFDGAYTTAIDDYDATKFPNVGENISFKRAGTSLAIERRAPIASHDTLFLNMGNMVASNNYRFEFAPGFTSPAFIAFLQDSYVPGSNYPLSVTSASSFDFAVTADPASRAANRFRIVFAAAGPLAVSFKTVKAYEQNQHINVEWKVENETDMQQYEVEKSTDGRNFAKMNTTAALNQGSYTYTWTDMNPVAGYNFYRIRSTSRSGEIKYSDIVKVLIGKPDAGITVYPNPVQNNTINLLMNNMEAGTYSLRLISSTGQVVQTLQLKHAAGNSTESIPLGSQVSRGTYNLEIIKPDKSRTAIRLIL